VRHASYEISQFKRMSIEKTFGRIKAFPGYRKTRRCGERVGWQFTFLAPAHNIIRIRNLRAARQ
jgi:hypothetical protein